MATWADIEKRIMARFDGIEAAFTKRIDELETALLERIGSEGYATRQEARDRMDEAFYEIETLAEDAKRRERLLMLTEARAAIKAGGKRGKAS